MGYSGAVASEDSTGTRIRRSGITKTGNAHARRVVIEAAWAYWCRPAVGATLRKRQAAASEEVRSDCLEGAASIARALSSLDRVGQMQTGNGDGRGPGAVRVHLGHRGERRKQEPSPENPWRRSRWRKDVTSMRQIERSIGGGRGPHGKENPRLIYAAGLPGSTRAFGPRQLPTDHDYAVPTREYQSDQPSQQLTRPPPMPRSVERRTRRQDRTR
jgi:hypothetical protein